MKKNKKWHESIWENYAMAYSGFIPTLSRPLDTVNIK